MEKYYFEIAANGETLASYIYYNFIKNVKKIKVKSDIINSQGEHVFAYILTPGTYEFAYENHQCSITYYESEKIYGGANLLKHQKYDLIIESESQKEAQRLLDNLYIESQNYKIYPTTGSISLFVYNEGWRHTTTIIKRNIDTIYMDPNEKNKIVNDIKSFMADEEDYKKFGIPYKRCYLFHGNPGSGKTSLIFALASMLSWDIYVFDFSKELTDSDFINAVTKMSSKDGLLVLEDIDSIWANEEKTVSMSCILNVLDGICRCNKLLIFMTANDIKSLSEALLRQGRVDYILKFSFAQKIQIQQMFNNLLPGQMENFDKFYGLIEGKKINMSLIQKFLFDNRKHSNILDFKSELNRLIIDFQAKDNGLYL